MGKVIALLVSTAVFISGCNSDRDQMERRAKTMNILSQATELVRLTEMNSGDEAPTSMPELVEWIEKRIDLYPTFTFIDTKTKTMTDAWGSPLVLVCRDGKLAGIGSCGADRKWNGGEGDDLVRFLPPRKPGKLETRPSNVGCAGSERSEGSAHGMPASGPQGSAD